MRKLVMSLTYQPKIEPVKEGRCTQTIRKGRRVAVGDEILFHGWSGMPYRSKWDWRKRVTVTTVINIIVHEEGIARPPYTCEFVSGPVCHWEDNYCNELAKLDFIDPPTGEALRDVLFGLNDAPDSPEEYQIIRWSND
ncbi:MAG: hypothetical protein KAJ93_04970 [Methanosarcinales archaeon]|nr:hypothetical protein [Methanosarcinales archaeon]